MADLETNYGGFRAQEHAGLEVAHTPLSSSTLATPQKEAVYFPQGEKEVALSKEKEIVPADGQDPSRHELGTHSEPPASTSKSAWRRKRVIFLAVAVLCAVIIAAVVGAVLGTKHTASTSAASSTTTAGAPTSTTYLSSTPASATPTGTPIILREDSGLAAVGWDDELRVYYQDKSSGYIMEAARKTSDTTWQLTELIKGGDSSAIAAAYRGPDVISDASEIHLYYTDANSVIQELYWTRADGSWIIGEIGSQGLTASSDTELTVLWQNCALCSRSYLLFYQDPSYNVQLANFTSSWEISTVPINGSTPSGLAVQSFHRPATADQVNLFYQRNDSSMALASWFSAAYSSDNFGQDTPTWVGDNQVYDQIPASVPLATASYGLTTTGYDLWIQLLQAQPEYGVVAYHWSGNANNWEAAANPAVMNNVQNYSSLAVSPLQTAYAVQGGALVEFAVADDAMTWTANGQVLGILGKS